jgi:hypothetical protein
MSAMMSSSGMPRLPNMVVVLSVQIPPDPAAVVFKSPGGGMPHPDGELPRG